MKAVFFPCLLLIAASLFSAPSTLKAQFVMPADPDQRSREILARRQATLAGLSPVSREQLLNPPAHEWLHWRRTYDVWGYSPLAQINRDNVKGLRLAWSWSLNAGQTASPPLVHDGVLFVHNNGDRVQALDAASGDLLWEYVRRLPQGPLNFVKKSMAIYGDKLFVPTGDAHLLALNISSGEVVWDHEVASWEDGYTISGGPMVVNDKVIMGMSGCGSLQYRGCFISAHRVDNGQEVWRFHTVAIPGEEGGESWNGLAAEQRYGGSVWMPGSYEPSLNLIYFGIGQPYPWNSELRGTSPPVTRAGISNEALFTNSTVALNPDSGELVWYYQHLPNDSWDMDYAFERMLIDLPVRGEQRKLVITAGKLGIVEALDAASGEFVFARDLGYQNIVTAIDPESGEKTLDRSLDPAMGETVVVCPHPGGARSWPSSAFHPETGMIYFPLQANCGEYTPISLEEGEVYEGGGGARWRVLPAPDNDGDVGRLQAFDALEREMAWAYDDRSPQASASLSTAGGLVFQGSMDRYFRAHDAFSGDLLWQTRLSNIPGAYPLTFSVDGKQYVAVISSSGTAYDATWSGLVPDVRKPAMDGATLWVFALGGE